MRSLIIFSSAHFLVDFCCAFLLFFLVERFPLNAELESAATDGSALNVVALFLFYNVLAFGTEFFFGLFVDARRARRCAGIGILFLLASLAGGWTFAALADRRDDANIAPILAFLTILLAGVGNSLFHLGGGIDALAQSLGKKNKYWRSGVFISTGALGLAGGTFVGTLDGDSEREALVAIAVALSLVAVAFILLYKTGSARFFDALKTLETKKSCEKTAVERVSSGAILGVVFAFAAVGVRSFGGFFAPDFATARSPELAETGVFFLASAAFLGKALGGVLADRLGGATVGFVATTAAIPALCWSESLGVFFCGVFLLNVSTAITLVAAAENCGERLGFAFGLTTLALLGGYFFAAIGIGKDASTDDGWADWTALFLAGTLLLAAFQIVGAVRGTEKKNNSLKINEIDDERERLEERS